MDLSQLTIIPIIEKVFTILSIVVYIIFSFVIVKQVDSMSNIICTSNNLLFKTITRINLIVAFILFVIILIIL